MDTPEKNEVEVLNPPPPILMPERGKVSFFREMKKKKYARRKQPIELSSEDELCGVFDMSEDESYTSFNNRYAITKKKRNFP
jgi:hypothetical protein